MRRLLILTLPVVLTALACDSDDGDGDSYENIKSLSGNPAVGETLFTSKGCAVESCHGADGNSSTANAARLADEVPELTDDEIIEVVLEGEGAMPAQNLGDQEMADVLAWLRTNF